MKIAVSLVNSGGDRGAVTVQASLADVFSDARAPFKGVLGPRERPKAERKGEVLSWILASFEH